jgi:glycosyltransferase involved in cell wall biosynthesis
MSDPKVCVIMPVYNGEKTIRLALNSLLAQSYSNWECVITNDGSTDGTDRILSQLTDPRFKVIQLGKNVGRGAARQVCLDHAEGEYLCYLDADDFYHKDKIKEQVQVMEHDKTIDMVACGILAYDDNYKALNIRGVLNTDISGFSDGNNLPAVLPTAMIRLHKALTIKYNSNLNAGEDLDYFSQYLDGGRFVNIAKLLYYYYTGTTTKQKVLSYTWNELKRGLYLMRRKPMNGIKVALVSASKYLAYGTLIPILGLDYFIQKRGHQFTDEQEHTYYQILKELKNEKVTA